MLEKPLLQLGTTGDAPRMGELSRVRVGHHALAERIEQRSRAHRGRAQCPDFVDDGAELRLQLKRRDGNSHLAKLRRADVGHADRLLRHVQ